MLKFPNLKRFSWNSSKEQKWNTTVQESASGRVRTMTNQIYPKWIISANIPVLNEEEARTLMGFVALHKGKYEPFLWLDPEDYKVEGIKLVQIDGVYQCVMPFGDYRESIEYIEDLKVYVDGVEVDETYYTVNKGAISFLDPMPLTATVTADYKYYWPVMLYEDGITLTMVFKNVYKASLKMVVVR